MNTEKQLTIDDYLNQSVPMVTEKEKVESLEVEPVDLVELSKEDLIRMVEDKNQVIHNMEIELDRLRKINEQDTKNLNEYYGNRLKESSSLVAYYERKLHVLKSIIDIETGGDK